MKARLLCFGLAAIGLAGCITRKEDDKRVRAAFLAGQQEAFRQMGQPQQGGQPALPPGATVAFVGPVKTPILPWTLGLTLAKAIIAAGYSAPTDPSAITILRNGQQIHVDPKQLLSGQDIPLEPKDIIEIKP